ncbi:hypothetical protein L2E82_08295 [Cichorium intybus]|uniref:Uncharacterized protein n=1 Tax=Cichorium intybus TaxID=13427 RepID=A0ACB9G745_CICIN|nr:hypothetical protein L2E82_08295 [Cichorium intybus]
MWSVELFFTPAGSSSSFLYAVGQHIVRPLVPLPTWASLVAVVLPRHHRPPLIHLRCNFSYRLQTTSRKSIIYLQWKAQHPMKSTLQALAFGIVMAAAARDYQKEMTAQQKAQTSSSVNKILEYLSSKLKK